MNASFLTILFQSTSLLISVLQLVAAVILIKDRTRGSEIMIGGGVVALVGQVGLWTIPLYVSSSEPNLMIDIYLGATSLFALGSVFFVIGLVLYALHRRGQGNRVAELEAIIETIQTS